MSDESKKIITDNDWKAQARKEKEKLKEQEHSNPPSGSEPLPPPSFDELVNMFALQAMLYLGKLVPPGETEPVTDLALAKHHIDMLDVIEQKTRGNLTQEEEKGLKLALDQMRWIFVEEIRQQKNQSAPKK